MRLLVLGGTEFAGRAVVEAAVERGWDVTVFNRGNHQPPVGAQALTGDRTAAGGLAALHGDETWDAVVDTWSWAPYAVRDTAGLLKDRVDRYVYVSSRSVYAWPAGPGLSEDAPLVEDASPDAEETDYARDKRGAELAVLDAFGDKRSALVRAGLILGPYENVGRLPWWLTRTAHGGPTLAPGPADLPLQYIDVRDLAEWMLTAAVGQGASGPYNLVGPPGHATMGSLLEACVRVTGGKAELRWTDPEVIAAAGIKPWTELPVWTPPDSDFHAALHTGDVSRALATGLTCRPVEETVADTWEWLRAVGGTVEGRPERGDVGLDPSVEAEVLGL